MDEPRDIEIFIIDDNKDITDVLAIILNQNNIRNFKIFNNPYELLEALNDNVHICVVDYFLKSDINGLELIKKIIKKNRHCWFIMLSGQDDKRVVIDYVNSMYMGGRYIEKFGEHDLSSSLIKYLKEMIEHIRYIREFYYNSNKILDGFNDLKNLLTES